MKASDAKEGMFVVAKSSSSIDGKHYWAGDIGYICNIVGGSPRVRRVTDDAMLGPVAMQNWEPYDPAPPAPVPGSEFVAGNATCPWCGAEWRMWDLDTKEIRWACMSSITGDKRRQSDTCQYKAGAAAVAKLNRLRELMSRPEAATGVAIPMREKINVILDS